MNSLDQVLPEAMSFVQPFFAPARGCSNGRWGTFPEPSPDNWFDIPSGVLYRRNVGDPRKIPLLARLTWKIEQWRGRVRLPLGKRLGEFLFYGRPFVRNAWGVAMQALVYEPALRYRCTRVGRGVRLYGGTPSIMGDGSIEVGDGVEFAENMIVLVGMGLTPPAVLRIGDDVRFGPGTMIYAAREVRIGDHCRTGPGVKIYDTDLHPLNAQARRDNYGTLPLAGTAPVVIEDDVWIGAAAVILKGVTLHRGAIIGAGAVVTESVSANTIVGGNPARVVRTLDNREGGSAAPAPTRGI